MNRYQRFLATLFLLLPGAVTLAGWENISPEQVVHHLRSVDFIDESRGYATGWVEYTDGTVQSVLMRTVDGGGIWQFQGFNGQEINAMEFTDVNTGMLVGRSVRCDCGLIKRTTDGGVTWQDTETEYEGAFRGVEFADGKNGIVGGGDPVSGDGYILRTTDGGASFQVALHQSASHVRRVHMVDRSTAFAASGEVAEAEGRIIESDNIDGAFGTVSWELLKEFDGFATIHGIRFVDRNTGFALLNIVDGPAFYTSIQKTTDRGATWNEAFKSTDYTLVGLDFADDRNGMAVGLNGAVVRTSDAGETWSLTVTGQTQLLTWVDFVSPDIAYAVGTSGTVLKFTNATGIDDLGDGRVASGTTSLDCSPNPTDGRTRIDLTMIERPNECVMELYGIEGGLVRRVPLDETSGLIETDDLAEGAYIYQVRRDRGEEGGTIVGIGRVVVRK